MPDIKNTVIISDMDNTLLDSHRLLSDKNAVAIQKFQQLGGKFTVATGRSVDSVRHYFGQFKPDLPCILYNGSAVYDYKKEQYIWNARLPRHALEYMRLICETFPDDVGAELLTGDCVHIVKENEYVEKHYTDENLKIRYIDLSDAPENLFKGLFAMSPETMDRVEEFVKQQNFTGVRFIRSHAIYYEMLPLEASKGYALKQLKKLAALENLHIVAVGDYYNDIEMLELADEAFAVKNAVPEVKRLASEILRDHNDSAIAGLIDSIIK